MNILKIKCHCGKVLTSGEYNHYETYRQPKGLPTQCMACSLKEIEDRKIQQANNKINEAIKEENYPTKDQEKELETEYYKDCRNFELI